MSGTSLDGLDMAYCHFRAKSDTWEFDIVKTRHTGYTEDLKDKLKNTITLSAIDHMRLDHGYGIWLGQQVRAFVAEEGLDVDFIASHGHTSHHRPELGITCQLGSGQHIANASGSTTICDFRSNDVALGGQGAPLVPIGDHFLFSQYTFCLNLGGICNISFLHQGKRIAYDIGVANMLLNHLSAMGEMPYDEGGKYAASGTVNQELLEALNTLPYYKQSFPKSTGYEWFTGSLLPLVNQHKDSLENLLCTAVHHITDQISLQIMSHITSVQASVLVTGGGAHNDFLINLLRKKLGERVDIIVPDRTLVDFKEALVFGFMGVLRMQHKTNVLASVTGAERDSVSGVIYLPS